MRVEHFGKNCDAAGSITLHHTFARLVKTYQSQSQKAAMKKGRNFKRPCHYLLWQLLWSLTSACQKGKDLWPVDLLYVYIDATTAEVYVYT